MFLLTIPIAILFNSFKLNYGKSFAQQQSQVEQNFHFIYRTTDKIFEFRNDDCEKKINQPL